MCPPPPMHPKQLTMGAFSTNVGEISCLQKKKKKGNNHHLESDSPKTLRAMATKSITVAAQNGGRKECGTMASTSRPGEEDCGHTC